MTTMQKLYLVVPLAPLVGAILSGLFGWVIGLVSAFTGFRSGFGPVSIGIAATRAVVWSIFAVMVVDAIVTTIWTLAQ